MTEVIFQSVGHVIFQTNTDFNFGSAISSKLSFEPSMLEMPCLDPPVTGNPGCDLKMRCQAVAGTLYVMMSEIEAPKTRKRESNR
jgi:hypothetical protein